MTANSEMNIRTSPKMTAPKIGTIPAGSTIKPFNFGGTQIWGNDSWAQIGTDRWVCIKRGDTSYFK